MVVMVVVVVVTSLQRSRGNFVYNGYTFFIRAFDKNESRYIDYHFLKPVTLSLYYNLDDVLRDPTNNFTDPSTVVPVIQFWSLAASEWVNAIYTCETPRWHYDTSLKRLELDICHLTQFALFLQQAPVAQLKSLTHTVSVPDQELGASAVLDASGSYDPDGQDLTYEWTYTSGPGFITGADLVNDSYAELVNVSAVVETPINVLGYTVRPHATNHLLWKGAGDSNGGYAAGAVAAPATTHLELIAMSSEFINGSSILALNGLAPGDHQVTVTVNDGESGEASAVAAIQYVHAQVFHIASIHMHPVLGIGSNVTNHVLSHVSVLQRQHGAHRGRTFRLHPSMDGRDPDHCHRSQWRYFQWRSTHPWA